jgi:adenylate cyclase
LGYEYLGEQTVKNIAKPVPAYKVLMESRVTVKTPAKAKPKMTFPLPDKPSIAIMPFLNLTGAKKQDFICDGLSESLITALSKVPQLFVIARDSTFSYKGQRVKTKQVSEELGVQYVLEGSVQRAGERVRVTAQLIDALTGYHLWSERYDRNLTDIFDLQDEITIKILTELRVKITEGEIVRIHEKGTDNFQAYMKVLEADGYRYQMNKEANAVAKRLLEEAVRLDPNYALAHIDLACALAADVWVGASESPQETLAQAMKEAQRAVELDSSSAEAQSAVSYIFLLLHQHDKAIEAAERAMRLNPNSIYALVALSVSLIYSFRCEEALPLVRQGIRIDPLYPQTYNLLGIACRETERYEEGIAAVKKALQLSPNNVLAHISLATLYSYAGREDEARAAAADLMRINPNFSLVRYAKEVPYKEGPRKDRLIDALRKAGLK